MRTTLHLPAPTAALNSTPTLRAAKTGLALLVTILFLAAVAMSQSYTLLHRLPSIGELKGGLILDAKGNVYGTTPLRRKRYGTVFELRHVKTGWSYKLLYRFSGGADGGDPLPGIVFDNAGHLHGATRLGGTANCNADQLHGCGTVFELTPTSKGLWTEKTLYKFPGGSGPFTPSTGLIADASGNLYGGSGHGSAPVFDGAIYRLVHQPDGSWTYQQLYIFTAPSAGMNVQNRLALDNAGNLYGATSFGGNGANCPDQSSGCGTVFQLSPTQNGPWTYTSLYSLCSLPGCTDGKTPIGVVADDQGNLFGTASFGGASDAGTIFELSPGIAGNPWTFNLLYSFCSLFTCTDGMWPFGAPVRNPAGNLYGVTLQGGAHSLGVVYKLSPGQAGDWTLQKWHDFCSNPDCADGAHPSGELTLDGSSNIYGAVPDGVVFEITP